MQTGFCTHFIVVRLLKLCVCWSTSGYTGSGTVMHAAVHLVVHLGFHVLVTASMQALTPATDHLPNQVQSVSHDAHGCQWPESSRCH